MPRRRRPLTLHDAVEDWLEVRSAGRGLSEHTQRAYRADVEAVARRLAKPASKHDDGPVAERVTVAQLTPAAVVRVLAALQRDRRAPATRARIHGTLAGLCAHLVHTKQLHVDPIVAAGIERPKQPRSLPRYIERDTEILKVLTVAATADPDGRLPWPERDLAVAAVLVGTGVRASELCGVRIRDLVLDVEDPYMRVTGKGGAVRDCPLPLEVVDAVEVYLADRRERTTARVRRDDPAWLDNHGRLLTPAALDHLVRRWFKRANLPLPQGAAAHVLPIRGQLRTMHAGRRRTS